MKGRHLKVYMQLEADAMPDNMQLETDGMPGVPEGWLAARPAHAACHLHHSPAEGCWLWHAGGHVHLGACGTLCRLSQCCSARLQQGADGADERLPAAGAGAASAGPHLAVASCRQRWQPGKLCILQHLESSLGYQNHLHNLQQTPSPPPSFQIVPSPAKNLHPGARSTETLQCPT